MGGADSSSTANNLARPGSARVADKQNPGRSYARAGCILSNAWGFLGENVTNFFQQNLLPGRSAGFLFLLTAHAVDALDQQEQGNRHDREIDADGDEIAPGHDGPLLLGLGERVGGDGRRQPQEVVGEVEAARDGANGRHEQVADQGFDDLAEGRPNDDADGEIDHVAPQREFLEFLEHRSLLLRPRHAPAGPAQAEKISYSTAIRAGAARAAKLTQRGSCCKAGSLSRWRSATSGSCSSWRATATACACASARTAGSS